MAYQFSIYPTGAASNYKNVVNSAEGVSAIIDRGMGINEHSMSGVAFYIKAIEDYINVHNVGTYINPIETGYFFSVGLTCIQRVINAYDGLFSGVASMYSVNVNSSGISNIISTTTNSGTFNNSIFGDGSLDTFTNFKLTDGHIKNTYSGYILDVDPLPTGQLVIDFNDTTTHPYYISDDVCKLNDVVTRRTFGDDTYNYGIVNGNIVSKTFSYSGTGNITVSGNVNVKGAFVLGADDAISGYLSETLFEFTHDHDGVNSRQISASQLTSTRTLNNPFGLTLNSGDFTVHGTLSANEIGLHSLWEEVTDITSVDNMQSLHVCGNTMFIADKTRMVAYGNDTISIPIPHKYTKIGLEKMSYSEGGMGDEMTLFSLSEDTTDSDKAASGYVQGNLSMNIYHPTEERIKYIDIGTVGHGGNFDTIDERRLNYSDQLSKIYGHIYFTLYQSWETFTSDTNWTMSLYEIPCEEYESELVGTYDCSGIIPMKSFQLEGNLIMPHRVAASGKTGIFIYNPVYQFSTSGVIPPTASGDIAYFSPDDNPISGWVGNPSGRYITEYTYFDNSVYYLAGSGIYKFNIAQGNKPVIQDTGISGLCSIVSYGGKVWTGQALENSYDRNGVKKVYQTALSTLSGAVNNVDPWVVSPVVHDGWLYAIAPSSLYTNWISDIADDIQGINYIVPDGAKLVRRRIAEIDLSESLDSYTC